MLDPPSDASKKLVKNTQQKSITKNVERSLEQVKKAIEVASKQHNEEDRPVVRKKTKNPNPLSCKKKKVKAPQPQQKTKIDDKSKSIEKPKRKRVKLPEHVKMSIANK